MKILFLVPPREFSPEGLPDRLYGCSYSYDYKPPLHLLSLATLAQKALEGSLPGNGPGGGQRVRLLDCIAEGIGERGFLDFIKANHFDMVVFFTVYVSKEADLLSADLISKLSPETLFVFTGAYPTWKPEIFLQAKNHIVLRGETEGAFPLLLESLESRDFSRVPNISYRNGERVVHRPSMELLDLNDLPLPDRRLLAGTYRVNRLNVAPVTAACFSRGCAFRCTFCAPMALDQAIEIEFKRMGMKDRPPLRFRSPEKVIDEFKEIAALGYRGVEVCDNEFSWGKKRTLMICEGIRDLGLEWLCLNRAQSMKDDEILRSLKGAGCRMIYMGTESFDQAILDDCRKKIKVEDTIEAVEKLRKVGIEPEISVLIGASPLETRKTALKSIKEAIKLNTRFIHFGLFTPFPNTELYDTFRKRGWLTKDDYRPVDMLKEPLVETDTLTGMEMVRLVKWAYIHHYLSPRRVYNHIIKIRSVGDLSHKTRMFFKFLRFLK